MKKDEVFFEYPKFENIREIVEKAERENPDNTAFIIKNKENKDNITYRNVSYKEFKQEYRNLGTGLYNLGLKDKRVIIISKNRYEWCLSYISVLNGGMIAVPLDKSLTEVEIENSILRAKADAIIFEKEFVEIVEKVRAKGNSNLREYICMDKNDEFKTMADVMKKGKELLDEGNTDYDNAKIDPDKMSILLFTSGTTSASKIVMLSHRNIAANIYSMHLVEDFRNTDVNLAFLPFHHTFGSTAMIIFLSCGAATAFPDGLRYIAQNLNEYKVTFFVGVPLLIESIYKKIMKEVDKQGKTNLVKYGRIGCNVLRKVGIDVRRKLFKQIIDQLGGSLRMIISGAASLDKEVSKGFNEMGIKTLQGYGLTETSPVLAAENYKYIKYGSCGFPMPDVEIKIVDKNEEGIGEIIAKGPNVMLGYYENEEATNAVLKDGWFYTGDLGYIDEEGFLFITGRKKDVIVLKNGKNIYPDEVETLINKLDIVKECMVFGLPKNDDLLLSVKVQYDEEYVKENHPNATEEELEKIVWEQIKEINKEMPTYKYIKHMILTKEDFVKTTTQKIKRFVEIKKILESESKN